MTHESHKAHATRVVVIKQRLACEFEAQPKLSAALCNVVNVVISWSTLAKHYKSQPQGASHVHAIRKIHRYEVGAQTVLTIEATQEIWKKVGKAVKKARIDRDVQQSELAEKAAISISYLSQIERGVREVSADVLRSIAEKLDLRLSELLIMAQGDDDSDPRFALLIKISKVLEGLDDQKKERTSKRTLARRRA